MIDDMLASNHSVHNRIVTVIVLLVLQSLLVNIFAQRVITLRSFETSPEVTAMQKQYERLDFNQRRCALIRIYLPVDNCSFEGSIVGGTSYSRGEYWVYVVENTKRLTIYCPTMEPSNIVWQPEIDNNGVVGGQTYIMKLNASAESLNAKIKYFRGQLHGVVDVEFFLYRLSLIYASTQVFAGAPLTLIYS